MKKEKFVSGLLKIQTIRKYYLEQLDAKGMLDAEKSKDIMRRVSALNSKQIDNIFDYITKVKNKKPTNKKPTKVNLNKKLEKIAGNLRSSLVVFQEGDAIYIQPKQHSDIYRWEHSERIKRAGSVIVIKNNKVIKNIFSEGLG